MEQKADRKIASMGKEQKALAMIMGVKKTGTQRERKGGWK